MNRLSGDQKTGGPRTFSVPANGCGSKESRARIHTTLRPSAPGARKAIWRPLGERVKLRVPAGRWTSKRTGVTTWDLWPRNKNVVSTTMTASKAAELQASNCRRVFRGPAAVRVPVCVPDSALHFNSRARSRAVCQRSSGFLARQQTIAWSNAADVMGFTEAIAAGSFSRIAAATLTWVFPSKARFPVTISYSTALSEKCHCVRPLLFPVLAQATCTGRFRRSSPFR
jgi:hypothetical protein